jgi:spermidine synthase
MAKGFSSSKAIINVGDGFEYLKNHPNEFDVIITDSSDPEGTKESMSNHVNFPIAFVVHVYIGPAEALFQQSFYSLLKSALKAPHGIICCQGNSIRTSTIDIERFEYMIVSRRKHLATFESNQEDSNIYS